MAQKCYKVQFTAHLHKLTLALKMQCEIQVIWKRGQKKCESGKVVLASGQALFDRKITISCNMIYNTKTKLFKQKITKFSIILVSQKGLKQAGQIEFNVAEYINQRQMNKKQYDQKLSGCPDKNAKLSFSLIGVLKQQISMDAISQKSQVSPMSSSGISRIQQKIVNPSQSSPVKKKVQQVVAEKDIPVQDKPSKNEREKLQVKSEKIKSIEQQNKKIKQQLKVMQKLKQENEQLRKKIKSQDFSKATEVKQKIQKCKKQVEKIKAQIRANKKIEDQTLQIQKDIFKCKVKIMKAFNFANQYGGSKLVDAIQQNCGYQEM